MNQFMQTPYFDRSNAIICIIRYFKKAPA